MADPEHLDRLAEGVAAWNRWRTSSPHLRPDLSRANLRHARLAHADFRYADLASADLAGAVLTGADLRRATLTNGILRSAVLAHADLGEADLTRADLAQAELSGAALGGANLAEADLRDANLDGASLHRTSFNGARLTGTRNLDRCIHWGRSYVDPRTFDRSDDIPAGFLRGCGLEDWEIEGYLYRQQRVEKVSTGGGSPEASPASTHYSCFISHSSRDRPFVDQLYGDLRAAGVRCWYAPENARAGAFFRDMVHEQIGLHERLLLVLSATAIESMWVQHEVRRGFAASHERKDNILIPIEIDSAAARSTRPWVREIRDLHIVDFTGWTDGARYRRALALLLRDLEKPPA